MPEFQGKTGEVKKIKLQSQLVSIRWGSAEVPMGGMVSLEVQTQFVSDGSEITITIKDVEGKEIEKFKGKIFSNYYRMQYVIKPNGTGGIFAQVDLSAHGLKGRSTGLKILPPVVIKNLKWLDEKGAELKEVTDGQTVKLSAEVNLLDGKEASFLVYCQRGDSVHEKQLHLQSTTKVEANKVSVEWILAFKDTLKSIRVKSDLEKEGLSYFQPIYYFEVQCMGMLAKSPEVKLAQLIVLRYESEPGKAGPFEGKNISVIASDGVKTSYPIPANGKIEIKKTLPGEYEIDESEVKEFL